jgi:hypothetical protein
MHLFGKAAAAAKPDVPKSRSGKILRMRTDGSADVSIEALGTKEWNLRFDVPRNVALLRRNPSGQLSEGCENGEDQVETSLDSCLYVLACGIQLANDADPSLLHVGRSFIFREIQKSVESRLSPPDVVGSSLRFNTRSSKDFDSEEPALAVLKLQSDEGLNGFVEEFTGNELQVEVHPPKTLCFNSLMLQESICTIQIVMR